MSNHVKGMTSSESEISNKKSNLSENSLKTCLKLATNLQLIATLQAMRMDAEQ